MSDVRIGIIGGGLMGRELAAVCGRWLHLVDHPMRPSVVAVADLDPAAREWFRQVPTLETLTDSWRDLVDDDSLDDLARALLLAARDPLRAHHIKAQNAALQHKLMHLEAEVAKLEGALDAACIRTRTQDSVREHKRRSTMPARWKGG